MITCAPYIEDSECSNKYYYDVNENDHITYMNKSCNDLSDGCKIKKFLDRF